MISPDGQLSSYFLEPDPVPVSPIVYDRTRMTDPDRIQHDVRPVRNVRDAAQRWAWHLHTAMEDDLGDEGWEHWKAGLHDAPHHPIHRFDWADMLTHDVWPGMTPDDQEALIRDIEHHLEED